MRCKIINIVIFLAKSYTNYNCSIKFWRIPKSNWKL